MPVRALCLPTKIFHRVKLPCIRFATTVVPFQTDISGRPWRRTSLFDACSRSSLYRQCWDTERRNTDGPTSVSLPRCYVRLHLDEGRYYFRRRQEYRLALCPRYALSAAAHTVSLVAANRSAHDEQFFVSTGIRRPRSKTILSQLTAHLRNGQLHLARQRCRRQRHQKYFALRSTPHNEQYIRILHAPQVIGANRSLLGPRGGVGCLLLL